MKIDRIDTITLGAFPWLILVQVHTDEGVVGTSDTYYTADAIRAFVHEYAAPRLLGRDPQQIERIWFELYERNVARWGGVGVELRAISALDACLWDILGQSTGVPVYQLLGGLARDRVRTYNTCAGPRYGQPGASPEGDAPGPLEDLWAQYNAPDALAEELLDEGYRGMKIWPFDRYALAGDGHHLSAAELAEGLEPIRRIRQAVGERIEIMLEGHGYWDLPTAKRIAYAVEEYRPAWLEDFVLAHDVDAIAELKGSTRTPVVASEYLITRWQYRRLLERRAADIVMVDPTWAGGITESRKIVVLAEAFGLPVAMHDCTGPFTLLAGTHLALSAPNAIYQESVRAFVRTWYRELVPHSVDIADGHILPPFAPGIGTYLLPEVPGRADATVQTSTAG